MALPHIPLDRITERNILDLIDAQVAESNVIEYKRDTYGNGQADYKEFLADVSSLANTLGGDLIIGIHAHKGIPKSPSPFIGSADDEILRLENVARSGLQPRISIEGRGIPTQGGHFLIFRVARSYNPPHRIMRDNSNRFWARSSAGKYEPNVDQLRSLFMLAPRIADLTRDFREGRLTRIATYDAPVTLMYPNVIVLHVVPFSAFDRDPPLPMAELQRNYTAFHPIESHPSRGIKSNFDGLLTMSNGDQSKGVERAYVQLFRGGIVEAVDGLYANATGQPLIPVAETDEIIISNSMRLMRDLSNINIDPPYAVLVSFITPQPARFNLMPPKSRQDWRSFMGAHTDRTRYDFKEFIFDSVPTGVDGCAIIMKPCLDQIAHAGGAPASPSFDKNGALIHRR
jgi:Putative DNA-binding domain